MKPVIQPRCLFCKRREVDMFRDDEADERKLA